MRYFMGFLIAIGLIVLIFVIILKGGSHNSGQPQIDLNSYATTSATAQLTLDGPITSDKTHQSYQISVGRDQVTFQLMQGYEGKVVSSKTYDSNANAFGVFLRALSLAGFTKGNNDPKLTDERGYCATGDRYIFELTQGADTIERYWATSCGSQGTYKGNVLQTLSLFQKQVPDYNNLTGNFIF